MIICLCVGKNKIQGTIPLKKSCRHAFPRRSSCNFPAEHDAHQEHEIKDRVDQVPATKCATCRSTHKRALIWYVRTLQLKNAIVEREDH